MWNVPPVSVMQHIWWLFNIDSGNGFVLSGNKPIHAQLDLCHHLASLGHDKLIFIIETLYPENRFFFI